MLAALLKGKLSAEEERLEDVLTACIFGALVYSQSVALLGDWLAAVVWGDLDRPHDTRFRVETVGAFRIEFWPRLVADDGVTSAEIDAVLEIDAPESTLIGIEAKLHSGKSATHKDAEVQDQLAREYLCMRHRALHAGVGDRWALLYVTPHVARPSDELRATLLELATRGIDHPKNLGWISWRSLHSAAGRHADRVALDIAAALRRHDLISFRSVPPPATTPLPYVFNSTPRPLTGRPGTSTFDWPAALARGPYGFSRPEAPVSFLWPKIPHTMNWMFRDD